MSDTSSLVAGPSTLQPIIKKPKPFAGHAGSIAAICYSPAENQIVTGGMDPFIRIWDLDTGDMMFELEGPGAMATSLCCSPDGKRLVSGNSEGGVCIWNTSDRRLVVERVDAHSWVNMVAYSPDCQLIATAGNDGRVRIWDAEDMTQVMEITRHPKGVQSVAFSPDGRHLATGCRDGKVRIFDVTTGILFVGPLEQHSSGVLAVTYRPDGEQFASCSGDGTIRTWDASTGTLLSSPGHTGSVGCMVYSPDGKKLLSSSGKAVRLCDSNTGKLVGGPARGHDGNIRVVCFTPDGSQFVTGAWDGSMRLWDALTQEIILPELSADEGERYQPTGPFRGHTDSISAVAYFPDGTRIATASNDGTIRIWDSCSGKLLAGPLIGYDYWAYSIAISSDGGRLVGGGEAVRVWVTFTGEILLGPLKMDRVSCVQFSSDDRLVAASCSTGKVLLWDLQTGKQLSSMTGAMSQLSFSPDGRRLASGGDDHSIRIWDVSSGEMVAGPLQGHTNFVNSLAFSPDGGHVVSGSDDRTVRIWDANTGATILGPLRTHSLGVTRVLYSPDGSRICSTSLDGTMCLWHARTGDLTLGQLRVPRWAITSAAFSPDGKRIVTGLNDCTIRFWDAATGEIIHFPDCEHEHGDSTDSVLDLPVTTIAGYRPGGQPQEIGLGSPPDLQAAARDDVMRSGPVQSYRPTSFSFSRLRDVFSDIFRTPRSGPNDVELQERHHRPVSRARVAYAKGKSLVHVAGGKKPRQQEMRDVSDDGSATDPAGDGDQNMAGAQGSSDPSTSRVRQAEPTNDAAPQTRQQGGHGTPSMERSAPYSAAPGIRFAADSVESEDSFETDCCACCPTWCTCLHP